MNFTFNCCPGMTVRKLFCNCCRDKQTPGEEHDGVLYADNTHSIVIMLTPTNLTINQYVPLDDLKHTDFATVIKDPDPIGDLRYVECEGVSAFRADRLSEEKLKGQKLVEVLPSYIYKFMLPIYRQTLAGSFCVLTLMWNNQMYLLRTYPIFDQKRNVLAAKSILAPFNTAFNPSVEQFMTTLNQSRVVEDLSSYLAPKRECSCW
jgi:hypothetical protein